MKNILALLLFSLVVLGSVPARAATRPGDVALLTTMGAYGVTFGLEMIAMGPADGCKACQNGIMGLAAVGGLGIMVAPSAGHIYVGETGHAVLWSGARTALMGGTIATMIIGTEKEWGFPAFFPAIVFGGGGFVLLSAMDIARAYKLETPSEVSTLRLRATPLVLAGPARSQPVPCMGVSLSF